MDTQHEVLTVLDDVLRLNGKGARMGPESPLLGAVPELDSMAVLAIITGFEERFGFTIADDELDSATFATVGALSDWLATKLRTTKLHA